MIISQSKINIALKSCWFTQRVVIQVIVRQIIKRNLKIENIVYIMPNLAACRIFYYINFRLISFDTFYRVVDTKLTINAVQKRAVIFELDVR